ncbi:DUF6527 family protein [Nocardioides sp.]|uniref:DUF6527 family protein n=1 Tax=Nocardioides sp. TaxID=35761 RepID=UPI00272463B6|nr:DUF6527 family protein [Nocardioides sp.]MDO9455254.1 DUF6527 family protein [Nocardioides sp.]
MSVTRLSPKFVEEFPANLDPGVLYVSIEYGTCGHLCACGCRTEVTTPLSPAQWSITYDGQDVSLWPSVGNWTLPCRSHYIIDGGRIRWARSFTEDEVLRNRDRDRRALTRHDEGRVEIDDADLDQALDRDTPAVGSNAASHVDRSPWAGRPTWWRRLLPRVFGK